MTWKPMYAKRLLKLADFLQTLPRQKFDFSQIAHQGEKPMMQALKARKESCGSVACAIGWMPAVWPKLLLWAPNSPNSCELSVLMRGDNTGDTNFDIAQRFFNIDYDESMALFYPGWRVNTPDYNATPEQVAAHIRRFVKAKQKANAAEAAR